MHCGSAEASDYLQSVVTGDALVTSKETVDDPSIHSYARSVYIAFTSKASLDQHIEGLTRREVELLEKFNRTYDKIRTFPLLRNASNDVPSEIVNEMMSSMHRGGSFTGVGKKCQ